MAKLATQQPQTKSLRMPFAVKAVDAEERTFTGLASTWDLDLGGDVIHPGAFKKTLREWKSGKRTIKLFYGHNYFSMDSLLGKMTEAEETKDGLEATFKVVEGERGDTALNLVKEGMLDSLSIGYRAVKVEHPDEAEQLTGVYRHLKEVELREVSMVPFPMNPAARIDAGSVKTMIQSYEGRDLDDEERAELKALREQLNALLSEEPQEGAKDALSPDDPKRAEIEARARAVRIRAAATRAASRH